MIKPLALFAIAMALGTILLIAATDDGMGLCTTDTECALLCPADDARCDGGPDSRSWLQKAADTVDALAWAHASLYL
jgi:hypothetical protein